MIAGLVAVCTGYKVTCSCGWSATRRKSGDALLEGEQHKTAAAEAAHPLCEGSAGVSSIMQRNTTTKGEQIMSTETTTETQATETSETSAPARKRTRAAGAAKASTKKAPKAAAKASKGAKASKSAKASKGSRKGTSRAPRAGGEFPTAASLVRKRLAEGKEREAIEAELKQKFPSHSTISGYVSLVQRDDVRRAAAAKSSPKRKASAKK